MIPSTFDHVIGSDAGTGGAGALCVQMDFTRTFEANTKCNNINYVWSHFYQTLVVLMYHRRLWNNNFDTDISRSINIPKKAKYAPLMWVFMHLKMSVSKILFHRRLWYFSTTKIWKKWLQTHFILLHLLLASNVHVKSIWTHSVAPRRTRYTVKGSTLYSTYERISHF